MRDRDLDLKWSAGGNLSITSDIRTHAHSKRRSTWPHNKYISTLHINTYIGRASKLSKHMHTGRGKEYSKTTSVSTCKYRTCTQPLVIGTQHRAQLYSKEVSEISGHMPSLLVVGLIKYIRINPSQRQKLQIPWEWIKKLWFLRQFIQIYSANISGRSCSESPNVSFVPIPDVLFCIIWYW